MMVHLPVRPVPILNVRDQLPDLFQVPRHDGLVHLLEQILLGLVDLGHLEGERTTTPD